MAGVFLTLLLLFIAKTVREWRVGLFHGPKTLHTSLASTLFFVTPILPNLDVACQGLTVWHSLPYLAVVLYPNRVRAERGLIGSELVGNVSKSGRNLYLQVDDVITPHGQQEGRSARAPAAWAKVRGVEDPVRPRPVSTTRPGRPAAAGRARAPAHARDSLTLTRFGGTFVPTWVFVYSPPKAGATTAEPGPGSHEPGAAG